MKIQTFPPRLRVFQMAVRIHTPAMPVHLKKLDPRDPTRQHQCSLCQMICAPNVTFEFTFAFFLNKRTVQSLPRT